MTVSIVSDSTMAWRNLRSLYPLYGALAREFVIEMQSCRELEEVLYGLRMADRH